MSTLLDETPANPAVRDFRSNTDSSTTKGWIYQFNRFQNRRLLLPLSGLAINLMLIGLCSYLLWLQPSHVWLIFGLQFLLTMSALALMGVLIVRVRRQLLNPLNLLRDWATRIRHGDLSARVAPEARIYLGDLVNDINHLGDSLQTLSQNME